VGFTHQSVALDLDLNQAVELTLHTSLIEQTEDDNQHQRYHSHGEADNQALFQLHAFEIHNIFLLFSPSAP
jgi:hypothetical protein